MKLLWAAVGTEFGGRHELYEMNYAGNHEDIRIQAMWNARSSGALDRMIALAEDCMAGYDERGWKDPTWVNPDDVSHFASRAPRAAQEMPLLAPPAPRPPAFFIASPPAA